MTITFGGPFRARSMNDVQGDFLLPLFKFSIIIGHFFSRHASNFKPKEHLKLHFVRVCDTLFQNLRCFRQCWMLLHFLNEGIFFSVQLVKGRSVTISRIQDYHTVYTNKINCQSLL